MLEEKVNQRKLHTSLSSTIHFGCAYYGKKTKELLPSIPDYAYVILEHEDIDEIAALSLIDKKVKAVINCAPSMTGRYPSLGTLKLRHAHIPVFDVNDPEMVKNCLSQRNIILIKDDKLWLIKNHIKYFLSSLTVYTPALLQYKRILAQDNLLDSLQTFTQNTLQFAQKELDEILKPIPIPNLEMDMRNKHVVVVSRGSGYREDLQAICSYIRATRPILIGVDGGADAILECGSTPDIIIGDMDSVSLTALHCGAQIIVHAYTNMEAPGYQKIKQLGLEASLFPCFGTSEDAAHLLAYEAGASCIVSLGSHTNMLDFLEKGRKGMGSTLLVRLKIGEKLIDAKGVRLLYPVHES